MCLYVVTGEGRPNPCCTKVLPKTKLTFFVGVPNANANATNAAAGHDGTHLNLHSSSLLRWLRFRGTAEAGSSSNGQARTGRTNHRRHPNRRRPPPRSAIRRGSAASPRQQASPNVPQGRRLHASVSSRPSIAW